MCSPGVFFKLLNTYCWFALTPYEVTIVYLCACIFSFSRNCSVSVSVLIPQCPRFFTKPVVVLWNGIFFLIVSKYYRWWRAAERRVLSSVLTAVTLLLVINVVLGKNKWNTVSWLHLLICFKHIRYQNSGVSLVKQTGSLVIIRTREIRVTLSQNPYPRVPSHRAAVPAPCSLEAAVCALIAGICVSRSCPAPPIQDTCGPACRYPLNQEQGFIWFYS